MTSARWLASSRAITAPAHAAATRDHVDGGQNPDRFGGPFPGPVAERIGSSASTANRDSADVEIGRSTYARDTDGALVVNDSVRQFDGGWWRFAMLRYRRNNG